MIFWARDGERDMRNDVCVLKRRNEGVNVLFLVLIF